MKEARDLLKKIEERINEQARKYSEASYLSEDERSLEYLSIKEEILNEISYAIREAIKDSGRQP